MKMNSRHLLMMLLLAFLFMAPGVSALYFYYHPALLSGQTTNKGVFVNPPIRISALAQSTADNNTPKWYVLFWSPVDCGDTCLHVLDQLARVRLALGRHFYEVNEALLLGISTPPLSSQATEWLQAQHIKMHHVSDAEERAISRYAQQPQIFIVNPEGYLVLSYEAQANPDHVYHDIKQLLTTTQTKSD